MFKSINIKKIALWLAIVMVASLAIAASILIFRGVTGTLFSGFNMMGSQVNEPIEVEKSYDANGIKDVRIDTVSEDVNIIPIDTNEIKAHFYGKVFGAGSVPEMVIEQNNETLQIRIEHKAVIGINIGGSDLKLDVYVPKNYSGALGINTVSAGLIIKGFNLDTVKYHSVSGDLSASDINVKSADFGTTSGRMTITGFSGDLQFSSVSGDLDTEYINFSNNIKMNTTSGRLRLKLPERSGFDVSFSSVSGDFKSTFPLTTNGSNRRNSFEGSTGNSSNKITAKTVSGDFEINK